MRSGSSVERFSTGSLKPMRLALAQINTTVGDLDGNRERILQAIGEAKSSGADLVLLPELAVTGYPPEDLLLRPGFVRAADESLRDLAREVRGIVALVGFPHFDGHSLVLDEDGHVLARAPGFEEALLLVDVEPAEAVGRRLRDLRRRALARERTSTPDVPVVHVGSPRDQREHIEPVIAAPLDELEQMRLAPDLGRRDYVDNNGSPRTER